MPEDEYDSFKELAIQDFLDSLEQELYLDNKETALYEFMRERLKSYYVKNRSLGVQSLEFIRKSEALISGDPSASLIYSSIATEVIIKSVLLKPIVYGLVINDFFAELVSGLVVKQSGLDRFRNLLFAIVGSVDELSIDLSSYVRSGSTTTLWKEREIIQGVRNALMHKAEECTEEMAGLSNLVAMEFWHLANSLVEVMGLRIDSDGKITVPEI